MSIPQSTMVVVRAVALGMACMVLAKPSVGAVLTMGVGQTYTTLAAAVAAANAGDTIDVLAGTYTDQVATTNVPLTIQGIGGTPVFTQTPGTELPGLKAYLTTNADLTVRNITFQNAAISDGNGGNGAGIRYQAGNLTVIDSQFLHNQDGILATPGVAGTGSVAILTSLFDGNGQGSGPLAGFEHGIYIGMVASLSVIGSTFEGTQIGHDIKSRAMATTITGNTLDDGVTGSTSYAIDISNGGDATITGNTIDQGTNTQNSTMIAYAAEGLVWGDNTALIEGNLFTNTNGESIGVFNHDDSVTVQVTCNAFSGVANLTQGAATLFGNVTIGTTVPACGLGVAEPPGYAAPLVGLMMLLGVRFRRGGRPMAKAAG